VIWGNACPVIDAVMVNPNNWHVQNLDGFLQLVNIFSSPDSQTNFSIHFFAEQIKEYRELHYRQLCFCVWSGAITEETEYLLGFLVKVL